MMTFLYLHSYPLQNNIWRLISELRLSDSQQDKQFAVWETFTGRIDLWAPYTQDASPFWLKSTLLLLWNELCNQVVICTFLCIDNLTK